MEPKLEYFTPLTIGASAAVIHLTRGKHAVVDVQDWPRVSFFKWHTVGPMPSGQCYASNSERDYLHRLVIRPASAQLVDHRDNNGLNCRRSNLRVCTQAQNQANRHARLRPSKIKGVHWHKAAKKWCAQLRAGGRHLYLGLFGTEAEAAAAYDRAAAEHFGEFANGNSLSSAGTRPAAVL